ncbi:MAG: hypothetical protein ACRD22_11985 [Terriglobia bacterium]
MPFTARDGKTFPTTIQLRRYEGWLDSKAAPGGRDHERAMKEHGIPNKVTIERGPMGRHRITATHPDGHTSTVVQGSNEAAHSILGDMLGVNPPIGQDIQRNASAHPTGPAESKRLAIEDHRETEI